MGKPKSIYKKIPPLLAANPVLDEEVEEEEVLDEVDDEVDEEVD